MLSNARASAGASSASDEKQPLIRSVAPSSMGKACFLAVVGALICAWCMLDSWQRQSSAQLFGLKQVNVSSGDEKYSFTYPLTLAFIQFAFMGVVFLALFCMVFRDSSSFSWPDISSNIFSNRRWPALVVTHIFSMFWSQSLMMPVPVQAISLGLLAASRAVEIPITTLLRVWLVGAQSSRKTGQTACLACAAVAVLYCAYAQVAGCLCVWSGHGVTLLGSAFWIGYVLVLLLPAANAVLQERVLQENGVHPVLMLSLMNLGACLLSTPILIFAHVVGWEDVSGACAMIFHFTEAAMLVTWLSFQMATISLVTVGIILMTNSFWAVALRALRVVYWWVARLGWLYASAALKGGHAPVSMSMACPKDSMWSFVMLCGFALAAAAVYTDRRAECKSLPSSGEFLEDP